jgi:hypothetical protein
MVQCICWQEACPGVQGRIFDLTARWFRAGRRAFDRCAYLFVVLLPFRANCGRGAFIFAKGGEFRWTKGSESSGL